MNTTTPQQTAANVIKALGGTNATARICDVASSAVAEWRKRGIPKARLEFLRLAFPDLHWQEAASTTPLTVEEVQARRDKSAASGMEAHP